MGGQAGVTHCGSWIVNNHPCGRHGWASRIVCNREAGHPGPHRSGYDGQPEWAHGVFVKEKT